MTGRRSRCRSPAGCTRSRGWPTRGPAAWTTSWRPTSCPVHRPTGSRRSPRPAQRHSGAWERRRRSRKAGHGGGRQDGGGEQAGQARSNHGVPLDTSTGLLRTIERGGREHYGERREVAAWRSECASSRARARGPSTSPRRPGSARRTDGSATPPVSASTPAARFRAWPRCIRDVVASVPLTTEDAATRALSADPVERRVGEALAAALHDGATAARVSVVLLSPPDDPDDGVVRPRRRTTATRPGRCSSASSTSTASGPPRPPPTSGAGDAMTGSSREARRRSCGPGTSDHVDGLRALEAAFGDPPRRRAARSPPRRRTARDADQGASRASSTRPPSPTDAAGSSTPTRPAS